METLTPSIPEAVRSVQGLLENYAANDVRAALLQLPTGQQNASFDTGADQATLTAAQAAWNTGDRVRITITGFAPPSLGALSTGTDYWLIKVSDTVFQLAASKADATGGTALDMPTIADSSQYALVIQEPNSTWPLEDVVAYEVTHAAYTARYDFPDTIPTVEENATNARIQVTLTSIQHTDPAVLAFNGMAIIDGAATPGDTTGTLLNAGYRKDGSTVVETTITSGEGAREIRHAYRIAIA